MDDDGKAEVYAAALFVARLVNVSVARLLRDVHHGAYMDGLRTVDDLWPRRKAKLRRRYGDRWRAIAAASITLRRIEYRLVKPDYVLRPYELSDILVKYVDADVARVLAAFGPIVCGDALRRFRLADGDGACRDRIVKCLMG